MYTSCATQDLLLLPDVLLFIIVLILLNAVAFTCNRISPTLLHYELLWQQKTVASNVL